MIKDNIQRARDQIAQVCSKMGRCLEEITIVAVSKGRGVEEIREAVEAGIQHIGENKVQEVLPKHKLITHNFKLLIPKLHMVGHLQTNKVKDAIKIFDLIQSVDSMRLVREIDKEAAKIGKIQDILIEVKTSSEATKFGFSPEEVVEDVKMIGQLENVNVKGLMTVASIVDDSKNARPCFRLLRQLQDRINTLHITPYTLHILSMGMSDDFEVAIEEGSTMVRLGRAIFSRQ